MTLSWHKYTRDKLGPYRQYLRPILPDKRGGATHKQKRGVWKVFLRALFTFKCGRTVYNVLSALSVALNYLKI